MRAAGIGPSERYLTLDVIRGVAVMGILLANLPAFGLPEAAYFSPLAWGGSTGVDRVAWFATFVLVEGKMRGLFSFLFGASMLLVIERARAAGDSAAQVHFSRMATLFAIGCLHLYLIWWGDILAHYALVGAIAYLFAGLSARRLTAIGAALIVLQLVVAGQLWLALLASAPRSTPLMIETWNEFAAAFGVPPAAGIAHEIAAMRGGVATEVAWRWANAMGPFTYLPIGGAETLGYMLLGMAGLKSGFITGDWERARYRHVALVGIGFGIIVNFALALNSVTHGFDQRWIFFASLVATVPVRPIMIAGYAALIVLAIRPGGWLTMRIGAAGRAAFTNYLGTSLLMTVVFDGWGLGLFADLSRAQLYLLAPIVWLMMLAWSQPWLAYFRYGPLEWAWRTLARLEVQPMRLANTTN